MQQEKISGPAGPVQGGWTSHRQGSRLICGPVGCSVRHLLKRYNDA